MNQIRKFSGIGYLATAILIGLLPFVAADRCAESLREGLRLCGGPLLLSLFPFLVVSSLLIQCPVGEFLGLPFQPVAWLIGVHSPCAGRVLLIGFLGGFAPAASAVSEAVRTHQMSPEEADALLPACVCSGPSFVILTVGRTMLGNAELGFLLFLSQILAGYMCAALLARIKRVDAGLYSCQPGDKTTIPVYNTPQFAQIVAQSAQNYVKLCGFVLLFRMIAAGIGSFVSPLAETLCSIFLEVCSGCDKASRTGYWASFLCCSALSVQGISVLLQVRSLCQPEIPLRSLYQARILHLPLSLLLFYLFLPGGELETFKSNGIRIISMWRVPTDCALLVFFLCCLAICTLSKLTGDTTLVVNSAKSSMNDEPSFSETN